MWRDREARSHTVLVHAGNGPLVGRRAELAWLRERLALAVRGEPQFVVLSGDAGVGKTRLQHELAAVAESAGFMTLSGRAHEGVLVPFGLVAEEVLPALEALVDEGVHRPTARGDVEALVAAADVVDEEQRSRVVDNLAATIVNTATQHALFLALDDVQWADTSSIALLRHLLMRLGGGLFGVRLFVAVAARAAAPLEVLRDEPTCAVIELSGLDRIDAADLASRLGVSDLTPGALFERTAGNPLLIEALARRDGGSRRAVGIESAFDDRLHGLSSQCLAMLEVAALLAPDLSLETLQRVRDDDALHASIDEALLAGVLTGDAANLAFAHPILRDRCLRTLGPLARARAHADIAARLGEPSGRWLVPVARHLVLAGAEADPDSSAPVVASAAQHAAQQCAWEESAELFEAALALERRRARPADGREIAALHLAAGSCRQYALDVAGGREHFDHAIELSRAAGDVVGEARARVARLEALVAAAGPVADDDVSAVEALAERIRDTEPSLAARALNDV